MKYTVPFYKDSGAETDRPIPDVNFFGEPNEDFTESYGQGLDYARQVENKIRHESGDGEKKQNRDKLRRAAEAVEAYSSAGESTDLLGSYTGITEVTREKSDVIIPRTENGKVYMDLGTDGLDFDNIGIGKSAFDTNESYKSAFDSGKPGASGSVPADYIGDIDNPEIPVQDADDL